MERWIEERGYVVDLAVSLEECLELAEAGNPELLIARTRFALRWDILRMLRLERGLYDLRAVLLS